MTTAPAIYLLRSRRYPKGAYVRVLHRILGTRCFRVRLLNEMGGQAYAVDSELTLA